MYICFKIFFEFPFEFFFDSLFKSVLFNVHMIIKFPAFSLLLIFSFIPLWLKEILVMILVFLKFFSCFLAYHVIYSEEFSMCAWEEYVLLLLDGIIYIYLSDSFGLKYGSSPRFPCLFSAWMVHPLLEWCIEKLYLLFSCCLFLPLHLLVFAQHT